MAKDVDVEWGVSAVGDGVAASVVAVFRFATRESATNDGWDEIEVDDVDAVTGRGYKSLVAVAWTGTVIVIGFG
jgi:hypothetical protein